MTDMEYNYRKFCAILNAAEITMLTPEVSMEQDTTLALESLENSVEMVLQGLRNINDFRANLGMPPLPESYMHDYWRAALIK